MVVSGLIAVLSVFHEMHAFTRPGAKEYIGEVGASHFCHIKRYVVDVVGGLATLCGDAEDFDFCGVSLLAGGGEESWGSSWWAPQRPGMFGLWKSGSMRNSRRLQCGQIMTGRSEGEAWLSWQRSW